MNGTHKYKAYDHIRRKLLCGELAAGERLSEIRLSEEIGISRTPVREAIGLLASEGLIEQVPRYGAFVTFLERHDLQELYELRELLESFAAATAAREASPEGIAEVEAVFNETRALARELQSLERREQASGDLTDSEYIEAKKGISARHALADSHFHTTLLRITGKKRVMKIIADFSILAQLFANPKDDPDEPLLHRIAGVIRSHGRILEAIKHKDAEAAERCMREHIQGAAATALMVYDKQVLNRSPEEAMRASVSTNVQRAIRYMEYNGLNSALPGRGVQ